MSSDGILRSTGTRNCLTFAQRTTIAGPIYNTGAVAVRLTNVRELRVQHRGKSTALRSHLLRLVLSRARNARNMRLSTRVHSYEA